MATITIRTGVWTLTTLHSVNIRMPSKASELIDLVQHTEVNYDGRKMSVGTIGKTHGWKSVTVTVEENKGRRTNRKDFFLCTVPGQFGLEVYDRSAKMRPKVKAR